MTVENAEGEQETIDSTPEHPFYVEGLGWVEASSLHAGMTIWFANGTKGTVEDISNEGLEEPVTVYNFEVKDFHTYFVGECGVLVHNTCKGVPDADEGTGAYRDEKGHHVLAQSSFNGAENYNKYDAFSISQGKMDELGIDHTDVTRMQRKLFDEMAASGTPNTIENQAKIAYESLLAGGADEDTAKKYVQQAVDNLKAMGVEAPVHIPWN